MIRKINKSGNSKCLLLSKDICDSLDLKNEYLEVTIINKKVIIKAAKTEDVKNHINRKDL